MKSKHQQILEAFQKEQFSKLVHMATELLKRKPRDAFAWKALGTAQKQLGNFDKAVVSLRRALEIDFSDAECHSNLSSTLTRMGRHAEALEAAGFALAVDPSHAEAYLNRGVALRNQFRYDEAKESYRTAIALKPSLAQVYVNLGNLYRITGELGRSIELCEAALGRGLLAPPLKLCLALSRRDAGQLVEAEALCREVLEADPKSADAHNNLAVILIDAGLLEEALEHCQAAFQLNPGFAEAYSNMGLIARDLGSPERAVFYYRKAIRINPDYGVALNNILFAIQCAYRPRIRLAARYARRFRDYCARARSGPQYEYQDPRSKNSPLRVGFVSGDLGMHPVGYFLRSFLPKIDRRRLEVIAYSTRHRGDAVADELASVFAEAHRIDHLADQDAAKLIHSHKIDVLFDLSGHTLFNRLPVFSYKPAPVQVAWLGYFASTGIDEMDYILGDPITLADCEQAQFREKFIRLPRVYFCFSPPDSSPDVSPLPAYREGFLTYGCFNSLAKINNHVIACWGEILRAVPESRLFLKARQYSDKRTIARMVGRFEAMGVNRNRIVFESHSVRTHYLQAYARVDMVLDPFPYPGGTTTLEALWMGVPTLSRRGDRLIGRNADMILGAMQLSDWLASDTANYIDRAVELSGRLEMLAALRRGLRERLAQSALMDAVTFAEDFTQVCETLHQRSTIAGPRHRVSRPSTSPATPDVTPKSPTNDDENALIKGQNPGGEMLE